jgi:hypothetical protein
VGVTLYCLLPLLAYIVHLPSMKSLMLFNVLTKEENTNENAKSEREGKTLLVDSDHWWE